MLFKMAALFMVAATTRVQTTGSKVQWIYESGPNKGYICAVMEQNGPKYDVFIPPASATPDVVNVKALTPVPWQQFGNMVNAELAVSKHCKL